MATIPFITNPPQDGRARTHRTAPLRMRFLDYY
jgi:hypothetical protein